MAAEVCPHRDLMSCTSMSLNSTSSLALLAGRRCLAVVELGSPHGVALRQARQSKWEVVCSEWSVQEERLVAVASNNKVEVLTCTETELVAETQLRAHTRVVTDLAWHTHNTQLLASSSADNFIFIWDRRDLRRPQTGLQAVQGAARLEWNKVSGNLLASAHHGEVRLWDLRKASAPVQHINAHLSRIYSLDWSWDHENSLATSSQDSTVQFWNLASPSKPENTIRCPGAPVWQLQHTPFGSGLLTLVMHTVLRGENNLVLWDRTDLRAPVHTFYGHTDMVLNFGWRCARGGDPRTRLVTWSKDGTLRLWDIDAYLQRKCGQEVEEVEGPAEEDSPSRETFFELEECEEAPVRTREEEGAVIVASPVEPGPLHRVRAGDSESEPGEASGGGGKAKSMNLNYEFKLLNVSEKLAVVAQDAKERLFTVQAETAKSVLILHVKFPLNYPNQKAPVFSFLNGTTVDNPSTRSNILNKIRSVAKKEISRNRRCLETCLRQFETCVTVLEDEEQLQLHVNNPGLGGAGQQDGLQDHNIPFPRSSGARFCGDGHLVTFGWTRQYHVPVARDETDGPMDDLAKTPRALTAMTGVPLSTGATSPKYSVAGMCGQSPSQDASYFPFKARVSRVRFSTQKISRVSITSEDGRPPTDRKGSASGRGSAVRPNTPTVTIYTCSALLPPGCKLLATSYLLPGSGPGSRLTRTEICARNAASAAAVERADLAQVWSLAALVAGGGEEAGVPWAQHPMGRAMLQDIMRHYLGLRDIQTVAVLSAVFGSGPVAAAAGQLASDSCLLDPSDNAQHDWYMRAYSDLLYKWQMLRPRTELAKCLSRSEAARHRTGLSSSKPLRCSLCRLPCRGLASVCPACGHGGHAAHLASWFLGHVACPTGCGCPCRALAL